MPAEAREQWLAIGRTLLSMHVGKGTVVDPYHNVPMPPVEGGNNGAGLPSSKPPQATPQ